MEDRDKKMIAKKAREVANEHYMLHSKSYDYTHSVTNLTIYLAFSTFADSLERETRDEIQES